ncbi:MAG: gamma-butyrobetaine hydroxylase-like domain-containing protein [Candidatus Thermoplasmatota archaeon]|nr:gamma-butyrobetaine hydroxylase-like domain-containing protein [Candidatus Thermoplasmatota archaeon]
MPPTKPTVRTVGNYALTFDWEDAGCSSGIYRFERLWALANRQDPDGGTPYVHGAW